MTEWPEKLVVVLVDKATDYLILFDILTKTHPYSDAKAKELASPDSFLGDKPFSTPPPNCKTPKFTMGSNSAQQEGSHVVTIWEVDKERLSQMEKRISETTPQLLRIAAGRSGCCVFRVPHNLIEINGNSYQPCIVSIGPYHRGQPNLKMMEELEDTPFVYVGEEG
jgi:hypothetical protein